MNRFEFKNVMKVLEINNPIYTMIGKYGFEETIHGWNEFEIYFYGSYYAVLKGRVPLEIVETIYNKYPNSDASIIVAGGANDNTKLDYITSNGYENIKDLKHDSNKIKEKHGSENCENLYINTKEGLIILITELQDYYAKKNSNNEQYEVSQVSRQQELLGEIDKRLIEISNPYQTTSEWINEQGSNLGALILEETINRQSSDEQEKIIRELLEKFDKTVNPFCNDCVEMLLPIEYSDSVKLGCFANQGNVLKMSIKDKKSSASVEHDRDNNHMTYTFHYQVSPTKHIHIHHYYSIKNGEEAICLYRYNSDCSDTDKLDLRYNLVNGLVGTIYGEEAPITTEQKTIIIEELQKNIVKAETITLNNMSKPKTLEDIAKVLK